MSYSVYPDSATRLSGVLTAIGLNGQRDCTPDASAARPLGASVVILKRYSCSNELIYTESTVESGGTRPIQRTYPLEMGHSSAKKILE